MVKPKKHLGQHFLTDVSIAQSISASLKAENCELVLEIGPGTGFLTQHLLQKFGEKLSVVELDSESVDYLQHHFPQLKNKIYSEDFIRMNIKNLCKGQIAIIGNFPYNISSQIVFKIIEERELIPEMVGMFQREVAERICSKEGSKVYGITSILTQAYYDTEYLFTVNEDVFNPPPKVKSAVIRLKRNYKIPDNFDHKAFFRLVKMAFNQRRKTMRNALSQLIKEKQIAPADWMSKRAEQLSVTDFIELNNSLS
jgi:16S rRNA (adenine1518-N6/adenine1519-N6)-dimethyltransferase